MVKGDEHELFSKMNLKESLYMDDGHVFALRHQDI